MGPEHIPPVAEVNREIAVWNPATQRLERGRRLDFFVPRSPRTLTWSNVLPSLDVPPDFDEILDILYAQRITVQGDSTHPLSCSTDIDLNLETSIDGATWDTIPYVMRNWGDNQVKTVLVEVGPARVRFRLDNNQANIITTDAPERITGTTETLVATIIIDPPGATRLIRVEVDARVSDGSGTYRVTSQRAGEPELGLIPLQTITNTAYLVFLHPVTLDSLVPLTIRFYARHVGGAVTNQMFTRNHRTVHQNRATFTARVLYVD